MIQKTEQLPLKHHNIGIFEKCQLAYSYERLLNSDRITTINKAAICRRFGIEWDDYYHSRRIITMQQQDNRFYKYGYQDKLEKLNRSLCNIYYNTEGDRIKYASKKLKKWDEEIEKIECIPKIVKHLLSEGYSNMFIELTITEHIPRKKAEPFLGSCLCCHSKVCYCEPNTYLSINSPPPSINIMMQKDWYSRWVVKTIDDWMERDDLCVCGHHNECHQIPLLPDDRIIPLVCKYCDCYLKLKDEVIEIR